MFDFQKLAVYQKAKTINSYNRGLIKSKRLDAVFANQLSRASLSVPLNIAEGSGKFSKPDRKNYYTTARASLLECVAILDILQDEKIIDSKEYIDFELQAEELSRMLFAMIRNLQK